MSYRDYPTKKGGSIVGGRRWALWIGIAVVVIAIIIYYLPFIIPSGPLEPTNPPQPTEPEPPAGIIGERTTSEGNRTS